MSEDPDLSPESEPPKDFEGLSVDEAAQLIRDWFFENFEDPVHNTPHDSSEGGYLYIWGGPYDAAEVIREVFEGVAPEEVINAAIHDIESDGYDWAPSSSRVLRDPLEPDENVSSSDEIPPPSRNVSPYEEMQRRVADLERALRELQTPGIGHNRPPQDTAEPEPLTQDEVATLQSLAGLIRAQEATPVEIPADVVKAPSVLTALGSKIIGYVDTFMESAAKTAGSEATKWAIRLAVWKIVGTSALDLANAVGHWLHAVHLPF